MSTKKISELDQIITPADSNMMPIVDSFSSTKKINLTQISNFINFISTTLTVINSIVWGTTLSVISSGTDYTKSGADGNLRTSAALFNSTGNVAIYLNGIYQEKGVEAIWASSDSFSLSTTVDGGDIITIIS